MKLNKILILVMMVLFGTTSLFASFTSELDVNSTTHNTSDDSNVTNIDLNWTVPSVDGNTTLSGYYYLLDTSNNTNVTDGNTHVISTEANLTSVSEGSHYFHVAPYDSNSSTVGTTKHFGPITIDTTAPSDLNISPDGGVYTTSQSASISVTETNDHTIYYTTNGDTPTSSSSEYNGTAITVDSSKTIKAIAIDEAGNKSTVESSEFTINATSNIAHFGNEVDANTTIATNATGGAITYTSQISVEGSLVTKYKYQVDLGGYGSETLKDINITISALADGNHTLSLVGFNGTSWQDEANATTLSFAVDNTAPIFNSFSLVSGSTVTSETTVDINFTSAENIYYEINGSTPDINSTNSGTVELTSANNGDVNLTAIAYDELGNKSAVQTANYTVDIELEAPRIRPYSGSYPNSATVTITAPVGTIRYTTDGTFPDNWSTIYTKPFEITSDTTIMARASDGIGSNSSTVSATISIYIPEPPPPEEVITATFGDEVDENSTISTNSSTSDTNKRSITIGGQNVSYYKYMIDSGSYSGSRLKNYKLSISTLSEGNHTIYLKGSNGVTWQEDNTTLTFTVDNTAPTALEIVRDEQNVTMNATDANSYTIHYTTDGSTPTANSDIYNSITTIKATKTIKAIAIDIAGNKSEIVEDIPEVVEPLSNVKNDFNGDGIADIFWRNGTKNSIWLMNADGTHTVIAKADKAVEYKVAGIGDFNGDGRSDIFWKNADGTSLWLMNEDGSHKYKKKVNKASEYKVAGVGDFNGDGRDDIFWRKGDGTSLWYMNEDGSHKYMKKVNKESEYKVSGIGDFNGDGKDDIFWRKGNGTYLWLMNENGSHKYMQKVDKASEYKVVGVGDFNGDGKDDIFWRKGDGAYIWIMYASGNHRYMKKTDKLEDYKVATIGDYDGDGTDDILWRNGNSTSVWLMNTVANHVDSQLDNQPQEYVVQVESDEKVEVTVVFEVAGKGDFNGDGISDILWRDENSVLLRYMNADGSHQDKQIADQSKSYKVAGIGDFDGDGIDDIFWRKEDGTYLWYMNADGSHRYKRKVNKPEAYKVAGIGDFNGDGIDDIFWRKNDGTYLWYMNADGSHRYKRKVNKPESYKVAGIADFDGDDIDDIFWRKEDGTYFWYMNADGSHKYRRKVNKPEAYKVAGVGDLNGDGIDDIFWRKADGVYLWLMNANGSHKYMQKEDKPESYKVASVGDFNGDGRDDIFWREAEGTYLWYMNANGSHSYFKTGDIPELTLFY